MHFFKIMFMNVGKLCNLMMIITQMPFIHYVSLVWICLLQATQIILSRLCKAIITGHLCHFRSKKSKFYHLVNFCGLR